METHGISGRENTETINEDIIFTIFHPIFTDNDMLFQFLVRNSYIPEQLSCDICHSSISLQNNYKNLNKKIYKCKNKNCNKTISVTNFFCKILPKVKLICIIRALYFFVCNIPNYFVHVNCNISASTYVKLRKVFVQCCKTVFSDKFIKLGGVKKVVQIDETCFKKGKLITDPSNIKYDDDAQIIWLLGAVEENSGRCILKFVINRRSNTISDFINNYIQKETLIKTDGYSSYPSAVKGNGHEHIIVNHSRGFRNEDGHTTNSIEGIWSLLKYDLKKRKGISRDILFDYLHEFLFKHTYVKNINPRSWSDAFKMLLSSMKQ